MSKSAVHFWLGGRSGYFLFFLLGGAERGAGVGKGGGGTIFVENPTRGVSWAGGGGGARGWEGVCGEFRGEGG